MEGTRLVAVVCLSVSSFLFVLYVLYRLRRKLYCCLPNGSQHQSADCQEVLQVAAALIKDAPCWQSKSLAALQLEAPGDQSIAAAIPEGMVTPVAQLRLPLAEAGAADLEASQASGLPSRALTWSELGMPSASAVSSPPPADSPGRLSRLASMLLAPRSHSKHNFSSSSPPMPSCSEQGGSVGAGSDPFSSFANPLTDIQFRRCDARREHEAPASTSGSFKRSGSFTSPAGGSRRQSRLSRAGSFVDGAGEIWWNPSGTPSGHTRPCGGSGMRTITSMQHLLPATLEDLEG